MRLFIAVNFSRPTLAALEAAREALRSAAGGRGSYTPCANLHLTLAFLGEADKSRVKDAAEALEAAAGVPFELVFDRAGRFTRGREELWWAGGPESPALAAVQKRLCRELAARGFELEARRFTPHVTLARRVPALGEAPALFASPAAERVEAISLMRSQLEFRPPRYTELHRTLLRKR